MDNKDNKKNVKAEVNEAEINKNEDIAKEDKTNKSDKSSESLKEPKEDIEMLKKQLEEETKKREECMEMLQRKIAEFDNFRKRTTKEKQAIYTDAQSDAVLEILPVLDNLERAIDTGKQTDEVSKLLEGIEMVLRQFTEAFEKLGVENIKAVGEKFDPNVHNAVMHVEDENLDENIIIEEFQKGYKIKDKVIRYSMVKVAN